MYAALPCQGFGSQGKVLVHKQDFLKEAWLLDAAGRLGQDGAKQINGG